MTQFDVAWHNDTFSQNDDAIDENNTFSNKKMTQSTKMTHFSKKNYTFLSSKSCFLNGKKRKVKFNFLPPEKLQINGRE